MRAKKNFSSVDTGSVSIANTWKATKERRSSKSTGCQTAPELFDFRETEIQSGVHTAVVQDQVKQKAMDHKGGTMSLLDYFSIYSKQRKLYNRDTWKEKIEGGTYFLFFLHNTTKAPSILSTLHFFHRHGYGGL